MEEKRRDAVAGAVSPASAEPTSSRRRGGGQKRNSGALGSGGSSSSASSKRANREKSFLLSQSQSLISIHNSHNGRLTRARQGPTGLGSASAPSQASPSFGVKPSKTPAGEAAAEAAMRKESELEAIEASIEANFKTIGSRTASSHVVPNHCGWFSWTKIHPVEEQTLPSFFNGKSELRTSNSYLEIRNWIMKKFHSDPNTQIESKDLSELEVADSDARQEVLEFLDYWGLINFHPFPQSRSAMDSADGDGDAVKTVSLADKLYKFETPQSSMHVVPRNSITAPTVPSRLFPEPAIADELMIPEYHCNSCSADCSRKRYHCQKQADFDLCFDCFSNKKFDSGMSSSDFILMEPSEVPGLSGGKWTDQETLLLLEALELYKENWSEIAEHVATKTKAQCILHFVQMPIEDSFLALNDNIDSHSKETANPSSGQKDIPQKDSSAPKNDAQATEGVTPAKDDQSPTSPKETSKEETKEEKCSQDASKPEDLNDAKASLETSKQEEESAPKNSQETGEDCASKDSQETGEDCAMKALKEAFEAVGYPLAPDGPISFAEVGNPVMAMAAFLSNLVGPDLATASAHNSLKSLSGNSPAIELAIRHCFILEDPPNVTKEPAELHSLAEATSVENQKEETQEQGSQKVDSLTDNCDKKSQDSMLEEKRPQSGPDSEPPEKALGCEEAGSTNSDKSGITDMKTDKSPSTVSEPADEKAEAELPPSSSKEMKQKPGEPPESTETVKDVEMTEALASEHVNAASDPLPSKEESQQPEIASSVEEKPSEKAKDIEMVPHQSEKNDPLKQVSDNPTVENGATDNDTKESDKEKPESLETKEEDNPDKLKRAAVTAISAAAVKAKLLANQEEELIRQLSTLLIEKQLQKLEFKLAFFNDMESVVMRVREQLERSRQRLYHERAAIIASRLGISASSSRMIPSSMPANRMGMNVAGQVPRPPLGMVSQRPPAPRPQVGTVAPAPSMPLSGSSIRPSAPENLSSVGTR